MVMKGKQGKSLLSRMEWGRWSPTPLWAMGQPSVKIVLYQLFCQNSFFKWNLYQKLDIKIYEGEATLGKAWVDMNLTTSHYELLSLPSLFKLSVGPIEFSEAVWKAPFYTTRWYQLFLQLCFPFILGTETTFPFREPLFLYTQYNLFHTMEYSWSQAWKTSTSQFLGHKNQFKKGQVT